MPSPLTDMLQCNRAAIGHAICPSTRQNRVFDRYVGHLYDLMIWPKRVTLHSLRQRYGIGRRTILRDFAKLRVAGIPILFDEQDGYYYLPTSFLKRSEPRDTKVVHMNHDGEPIFDVRSEWPLNWMETVAILAVLVGARPPHGSELQTRLGQACDKLTEQIEYAFGDQAGSIFSNAKLLSRQPSISISELHHVIESFRSQNGRNDCNGNGLYAEAAPLTGMVKKA